MTGAPRNRRAIIDIGSNSVRLVVYSGAMRAPSQLLNEKVMAGLGRDLQDTGRIAPEAMARAIAALRRYRTLCIEMEVGELQAVATAAVRDAVNGGDLIEAARQLDLSITTLSGIDEARYAGLGVLSAFPGARGVVADLGGGSLELAILGSEGVEDTISMPLGVLRLGSLLRAGEADVAAILGQALLSSGWTPPRPLDTLYLVGGSWRALARLHLESSDYPLRLVHGYTLTCEDAEQLTATLVACGPDAFAGAAHVSRARLPTLDSAARLLGALLETLRPRQATISSSGLREGMIFDSLAPAIRTQDPLIVATSEAAAELSRFPLHGEAIDAWLSDLFDDNPADRRIRRAACNLGDVAWRANPEFRAERGVEIALHGNWVGIDVAGRDMLAQAMFTTFGGGARTYPHGGRLASPAAIAKAIEWGLAIRLAQRFSGGTEMPLKASRLVAREGGALVFELNARSAPLAGETVEKRLRQLAQKLGRTHAVRMVDG